MPGQDSMLVRVNLKVLLIILAVTLPLLLVDMFLALDRSRERLSSAIGGHFETIAQVTASEVSRWIHSRVVQVGVLAANPEVRRAVAEANRSHQGVSESAMQARFKERDENWDSPKVAPIVSQMLSNSASVYLREFVALNPSFKRILVADGLGASVAGSHKSIDYYQADEDWWTKAFGDGWGGVIYVEDPQYDSVTRINFVGINAPVLDAKREQVIGVVRTIVDLGEMMPITGQVRFGKTGDAILVKGDGTLLSAANPSVILAEKADELEAIKDMEGAEIRASGYTIASLKGGNRKFLGFADVGLAQAFPDLEWRVIVSQDYEESTAPITAINNRVLISGFLAIGLIVILAIYFSLHRPEKLTDIEEVSQA